MGVDDADDTSIQLGSNQERNECLLSKDACLKSIAGFTRKKLFILQWIPTYSSQDFVGDLLAGLTIGLTVIPQGMALASLVGVPSQVLPL